MATATAELIEITGIVIELHPKSGEKWSRAKVRQENGSTIWVVCKFALKLQEVLTAKCTYNEKFRSYDVQNLVDDGEGKVSNAVVILKLVETLDGVGKVKARRLGEQFPELFEAIINTPEAVAAACGATLENVQNVAAALREERGNLTRVTALTNLGYPNHLAKQIALVDASYRVALESPYAAIRLVSGLGWLLADEVGRKMGIKPEDSSRIEAGIDYYYYENVANDGHTRVRGEELLYPEALPSLLGIRASLISEKLEKSLIPLGNGWYTSEVHRKNAEVIAGFFLEQ
jgi:hypothetical protein